MPAKKYLVKLEPGEREQLLEMTRKGETSARKMKRARYNRKLWIGARQKAAYPLGAKT